MMSFEIALSQTAKRRQELAAPRLQLLTALVCSFNEGVTPTLSALLVVVSWWSTNVHILLLLAAARPTATPSLEVWFSCAASRLPQILQCFSVPNSKTRLLYVLPKLTSKSSSSIRGSPVTMVDTNASRDGCGACCGSNNGHPALCWHQTLQTVLSCT